MAAGRAPSARSSPRIPRCWPSPRPWPRAWACRASPVEAVTAATGKTRNGCRWAAAALAQPAFRIVPAAAPDDSLRQAAAEVGFPCVIKAVSLSASQGILRADSTAAAVTAAQRIRQILATARRPAANPSSSRNTCPGRS